MDAGGGLFLAYVRPVRGVDQVFLARSGDAGRTWRSEQMTDRPRPARLPSVALFPDGSLHLVWTEYAPIGTVMYGERRGGRWSTPLTLSASGVYAGVPVVAALAGRPHVLWYGILPERPEIRTRHGSIYEILFTRRAERWRIPISISAGPPDSINPALAAAAGLLHAAWYQFDGRVYQIRYARFTGRWGPPEYLTAGPGEHTRVALAADGTDVYLVWEEQVRRRQVISLRLGRGSGPMVALRGATAYVAWTSADAAPQVRFAAVPLP